MGRTLTACGPPIMLRIITSQTLCGHRLWDPLKPREEDIIIGPILEMRRLRLREVPLPALPLIFEFTSKPPDLLTSITSPGCSPSACV